MKLIHPLIMAVFCIVSCLKVTAQDIGPNYFVAKVMNYAQQGTTGPVAVSGTDAFDVRGNLQSVSYGAILTGSLTASGGNRPPLILTNQGDLNGDFGVDALFSSENSMDTAYVDGTFALAGQSQHGTYTARLNLTGTFSSFLPPALTTFTNAIWNHGVLTVSSTAAATINWTSSQSAAHKVLLSIQNSGGIEIYKTLLSGNTTSYTLPALPVGTYNAYLTYLAVSASNSTSISGATGYAGYAKETSFVIQSVAGPIPTPSRMVTPVDHSIFQSSSITFTWDTGFQVTQNILWVGSTPNSYDLFAATENGTSDTVNGLPTDGRTVYVTLWSVIDSVWYSNQYTYTAQDGKAQMLTPVDGSTFTSISGTFTWNTGIGVSQYAIWVGSSPNSYDIRASLKGLNQSDIVALPTDGRTIYVTLWSMINGAWQGNGYSYNTLDGKAQMLAPVNGSALASSSGTFSWSPGAGVSQYALWVGSAPNAYDICARIEGINTSDTVTNLPTDGRTLYVSLWSMIGGVWSSNSYSYTAYFNPAGPGPIKAMMLSPTSGSAFTSSSGTFTWSPGKGVSQYALWVGSTSGTSDLYAALQSGTSQTVTLPTDGRPIYVRLYSQINGAWVFNGYTYYAFSGADPKAVMTSPLNSSTFASSSVTFNWNAGTGASRYALWVGTNPDSHDLYAMDEGQNLSDTVMTLPVDGRPIYVDLWSMINGVWQANKYVYVAATQGVPTKALITSPVNGTLLTSASLTLNWNAGVGATQYALWVGSAPNTYDIYAAVEGKNLSQTVQVPLDGRRVYVQIWSLVNGSWLPASYYYDTTQ